MAYGGGSWDFQNKALPGSYISFVSAARASAAVSERGIAAFCYTGDWGPSQTVFKLSGADFAKNCKALFGVEANAPALFWLRELFRYAKEVLLYRLNGGYASDGGVGYSKYPGKLGNSIAVKVEAGAGSTFNVTTTLAGVVMDYQAGVTMATIKDNDYVTWERQMALLAGNFTFSGGTTVVVSNANYSSFLTALEPYYFHTLGTLSKDKAVTDLFVAFVKRMRGEYGAKMQAVLYRNDADYEGVVSVYNTVKSGGEADLVPWVTGLLAGCAVGKHLTGTVYDGELSVSAQLSPSQLTEQLALGRFTLHLCGEEARVLRDINSLVSVGGDKGEDFQENATIRVLDQIATDVAALFIERYLGVVPNDASGRISLWNDIVKHHEQLARVRAIDEFSPEDVTVEMGDNKRSVVIRDRICPVGAMTHLYMTVVVA